MYKRLASTGLASLVLLVTFPLVPGCASKTAPAVPPRVEEARRAATQAARLQERENWVAAAGQWELAAQRFQLLNDLPNLAIAWHNQAQALRAIGQVTNAIERLEQAAELNGQLGRSNEWWRNQIALLQTENDAGRREQAQARAQTLTASQGSLEDPQLRGLLAHELARVAVRSG